MEVRTRPWAKRMVALVDHGASSGGEGFGKDEDDEEEDVSDGWGGRE